MVTFPATLDAESPRDWPKTTVWPWYKRCDEILRCRIVRFWYSVTGPLGPSHTTSSLDWRGCVFRNFHDNVKKMAKTRRQTHFRKRRGGACVDAVASAFFAFFVVWWLRPPFVDSSFEGNVRCRIILIVEKFLLGIRSFPFLRSLSTLLHGFHCWLLASTFSCPADNHRGSLANMKRCLRHHVVGCPPFTVGPQFQNLFLNFIGPLQQLHWGMLKKKTLTAKRLSSAKKPRRTCSSIDRGVCQASCSLCFVL